MKPKINLNPKYVLLLAVALLVSFRNYGQQKPFPQAVDYPGTIKPALAQSTLNSDVAAYYSYWKNKYLKTGLSSLPDGYYVKGEITGNPDGFTALGSSEGQGYGMIITALMAGYDTNAKLYFDGLLATARAFRSVNNPYLMGWVVADDVNAQGHFSSATDGDMDIAYALILAHYQWGSGGSINYIQEAVNTINALKLENVTTNNRLNLGDWDAKSAYNTRPSDWMFSHMRAFYNETNDVTWSNVINNLYGVYGNFSSNYSSSTGLVSDFIVNNPPQPAPPNYLGEFPETGDYYYNAGRFPLRVVMDYALYGTTDAYNVANKLISWVKPATGNNPANIRAGYQLNGTPLPGSNYQSAVFIAPFVAASVVSSSHQDFLNSGWNTIRNMQAGYFEDTYNLLCMLFISGNWWKPDVASGTPPAAPTALSASAASSTQINLSWVDNAENETGFQVERSPDGSSNWSVIATPGQNISSYTDAGLSASTTYYYRVKAVNESGSSGYTNMAYATTSAGNVQSPFDGFISIPGTLEAENFDLGGAGIAYSDNTTANEGGEYRTGEAVDIEPCTLGGYNVGWTLPGEWLEYSIDVDASGNYALDFSTAAESSTGSLKILVDGADVSGTVSFNATGGWQVWQTHTLSGITLEEGQHILRIEMISGDFNLDKITFSQNTGLPSPYSHADIGAQSLTGSASYANGTFTLEGAGNDIWGTNDQFLYVYRTLSGDGEIVARVNSISNTNPWAKAGVMIRETLAANARHAMIAVTPSNGVAFQNRSATGGTSSHTAGSTSTAPHWLRLVRSGSILTAYESPDGTNWNEAGSLNIAMASDTYIGLVVTSHDVNGLGTATFDHVTVSDNMLALWADVSETNNFNTSVYPNPASTKIALSYELHEDSQVFIEIFDMSGHKVSVMETGVMGKGKHRIEYDISALHEGIYLVKIRNKAKLYSSKFIVKD